MAKGSVYEGKTFEEAVRKGLESLRLQRAEANITLIDEGKGGFLGFGARPFRVSVMRRPGGPVREPEEQREYRVGGRRDERRSRGGRDRGREERGDKGREERGDKGREERGDKGREERGDKGREERGDKGREERGDKGREERGDRGRDKGRGGQQQPQAPAPAQGGGRGDAPRAEGGRGEGRRGEGRRERRGEGRREERGREERREERPAPPVELTRPPVVEEDEFEEVGPAAVVAGVAGEDQDGADSRRRRRRGRRGGRGRRRGGAEGDSRPDAPRVEGGPVDDADVDDVADVIETPVAVEPVREIAPAPVAVPAPVVAAAPEPERESEPQRPRQYERPSDSRREREYERPREPRRERERSSEPPADALSEEELGELCKKVTLELLAAMGFEAQVQVVTEGTRADVTVEVDDDDELLTGEKGETRQALQHLLNRFVNRGEGAHYHLQLEINDFWKRREVELEALAHQLADEAVATGAEVRTGYLSSQERRIVHVTLKTDTRVRTDSIGEDVKRFVVVIPVGASERSETPAS